MFDWLFGASCPVSPERKAWLERGLNWLGSQFGAARMLARPVVLPTPAFFPDPYDGTFRAAGVLFDRVCGYMEVSRDRVILTTISNMRDAVPRHMRDGRFEGAAGVYIEDKFGRTVIGLDEPQLADPTALVATMAHELAHVHLLGDRRLSPDSPDHEPLTDLLAVLYGLGVFNANAVIRESNWSDGSYSGWSVSRQGYLTGAEYGYALAVLARARGEAKPAWAAHLRPDPRAAFWQGLRYLKSAGENPFPDGPGSAVVPEESAGTPWTPAPARGPVDASNDVPWTKARPASEKDDADEDDLPAWANK